MTRAATLAMCGALVMGFGRCATAQKGEGQVAFEYGFRHDPMEWVGTDESLQAALVRRHVFDRPNPNDAKVLQQRIGDVLSEQNEDGTLSDDERHRYQFTAGKLIELGRLGVDPEREEVKRAVEVILHKSDDDSADPLGTYVIRALCLLGIGDRAEVKEGLQAVIDRQESWNGPYEGCPWTPIEHLETLWYGRELVDSTDLIRSALAWIGDQMNGAGCVTYKDPWGFVRAGGLVELPEGRRIVEKAVPVILRGQEPDGGWGDRSLPVLRALVNHGLLEELRRLPPLPADWQIVREIPAPEGELGTLAYDGERLWTRESEANEAIAISPKDGSIVRRVKLPDGKCVGVGWWDDGLGVTQADPKRLLKLDPATGEIERQVALEYADWVNGFAQVNGELWVADGFMGHAWRVDPAKAEKAPGQLLAGPCPADLAATADGVWHTDVWAPAIIKSDLEGKLLDWGEKPFEGRCDGLAWDGEHLWALDAKGKRICAIEKALAD